ncbi:hypothetical protein QFZ43_006775 [Streptomyces afghaniensis]|nr:hypothetical protein [Streptomyces afghaniensis]
MTSHNERSVAHVPRAPTHRAYIDAHGAAPQLRHARRRFSHPPRPQLQHPLHARRHRRPGPCHPRMRTRPGPDPRSPPLLPLAQETRPSGPRIRPGRRHRRRHHHRPGDPQLAPGERRTHGGRPPAPHPRPAPPRLRHGRRPLRRHPPRRPELSPVAAEGRALRPGRHAPGPARRPGCGARDRRRRPERTPRRTRLPPAGRHPDRLPGRVPLGRRAHLDPRRTPTSASTRSSRPRASRFWAAVCRPHSPG